jgi:hypothetical protein
MDLFDSLDAYNQELGDWIKGTNVPENDPQLQSVLAERGKIDNAIETLGDLDVDIDDKALAQYTDAVKASTAQLTRLQKAIAKVQNVIDLTGTVADAASKAIAVATGGGL